MQKRSDSLFFNLKNRKKSHSDLLDEYEGWFNNCTPFEQIVISVLCRVRWSSVTCMLKFDTYHFLPWSSDLEILLYLELKLAFDFVCWESRYKIIQVKNIA